MESQTAMPPAPPEAPSKPRRRGRRRIWPRFRARLRQIWRRLVLLLGPLVITGLLVWAIGVLTSPAIANELLILSGLSFFGLGTTVILAPAAMGGGLEIPFTDHTLLLKLGTWEIALWLMWLNIAAAFLYAYNLDLLEKVPVIGPFLHRARQNATDALSHHPWIRRLAGVGVLVFVLLPGPGSGQLGGCFVGRVVGLKRWTIFWLVGLAGSFVALSYALFGAYIKGVLDDAEVGNWIRIGGLAVALIAFGALAKLLSYLGRDPTKDAKKAPVLKAPVPEPDSASASASASASTSASTSAVAAWLLALFVAAAAVVGYILWRAEVDRVMNDPNLRPWILTAGILLVLALLTLLANLARNRRLARQARITSL